MPRSLKACTVAISIPPGPIEVRLASRRPGPGCRFQFHQVRLKYCDAARPGGLHRSFQFHQVRLKYGHQVEGGFLHHQFQFHQVRLKCPISVVLMPGGSISIPPGPIEVAPRGSGKGWGRPISIPPGPIEVLWARREPHPVHTFQFHQVRLKSGGLAAQAARLHHFNSTRSD